MTPVVTSQPTSAPTLDPEAELQRIMELRAGWGLDSDEDWILEVAADPDADTSLLGIPLSSEEVAQMEQMFADDPRSRLIVYGYANPDQYAGSFVDNQGAGPFVMLFTDNLDQHRAQIEALPGDFPFEVRGARYTEQELMALMTSLSEELRHEPGVDLMSVSLDTIANSVGVEAKTNDPTFESRLEARYAGMINATTYPIPGPWANVDSGPGWRLLAAGIKRGGDEGYKVYAATTEDEWQELWTHLDPINPAPEVNLDEQIVASFGHAVGSSCPEMRLDGVVIDADRQLVFSQASDPLAPRGCTADLAGAAFFVVALERAALPASPFTVRLAEERICGGCGDSEEVVVDFSQ